MFKIALERRLPTACCQWKHVLRAHSRRWSNVVQASDRNILKCQSRILPGPERIRVAAHEIPADTDTQSLTSVYDALLQGQKLNENKKAFGYWHKNLTELTWLSYEELLEKCQLFGSALLSFGQVPRESIVTVNCRSSMEWAVSHYSTSMYSLVSCPITANADRDAISFVLQQVECSVMVCDTVEKAEFVLKRRKQYPLLRVLISVEDVPRELVSRCHAEGIELLNWQDCLKLGAKGIREPIPPTSNDLYSLLYTSGTTGMPKGVPLTHKGIITTACAVNQQAGVMRVVPGNICFSFLPTGHVYEHIYQVTILACGGTLGFYRGDVKSLLPDVQAVKPTNIPMVPRLLNRIYYKVHSEVQKSPLKNLAFKIALNRKRKLLKRGIVTNETIWDKLVFKKIRDLLGGNVRYCLTTSAPVSGEVLEFFRLVFGCLIVEVYGSTEVSVVTSTLPYDFDGDHVGCPFPGVEVKLIDVPEMDYFAKEDKGEICVRSPMTLNQYYKNPEATQSTLMDGGWVKTGDIGTWTSKGTLKVIDRKKDIFKLAQGEYISPERIESAYGMLDTIAVICVEGSPMESYCVALVIPQEEQLRELAASRGVDKNAEFGDLCSNIVVRKALLKEMRACGKANGLSSLHQVQNIYLHPEKNLLDSGLITSTLKLKRNVVRSMFKEAIENMYKEGPLLVS